MATAIRGGAVFTQEDRREDAAEMEVLPFDFFIRLNIYRDSAAMDISRRVA
jgi:hypothetical protein